MNRQKFYLLIFLLVGTSRIAVSQFKVLPFKEKLKTYLKLIHTKKSFSGEILVARDADILFQQTIGLASVENNVELKKGAEYYIASITKTFTGSMIAIAREEGRLNVEDKVISYISGLSFEFKEITIKQLLNHRSGLPHYESMKDYWPIQSKLQLTTEQVIAEINKIHLLFEPGTETQYSSLGYYLLAVLLEKVYKDEFCNILQNKIFDNLKMRETGTVNTLRIIPKMTSGYYLVNDDSLVVAPYRNYSMLKGAGDMYSNTMDLLKWNISFFSNALCKEIFIQNKERYGYGWNIENEKIPKLYHGGGTWGYSASTALYPEERISIIILSNVSALPMTSIASDVEKIVFDQPFEIPSIEQELTSQDFDLRIYCGKFVGVADKKAITFTQSGSKLYAQLQGSPAFEIYFKGNHQFFSKKVEIEFAFEVENEIATGLKALRMGKVYYFKK